MTISYEGYKNKYISIENSSAGVGNLVTIDSDGKLTQASTGVPFIGVCVAIKNGVATVQTDGYIEMPYQNKPSFGMAGFTSTSGTKVNPAEISASIKPYTVLKIDTDNKTVGFIL